ncbi:MAG: class I SAM-dependent methyltransferase [Spirochaetia bacterium]|nr:class I SAM-dependent methyltransferase [Spirochaetia bacterium]
MENKTEYQAQLFANRLKKKYKELRKWARKNRITCYRIYNKDIPEIPVSLDLYEFLPSFVTTPIEVAKFLTEQNEKISQNDFHTEKDIKSRTFAVLYLYERPYEKQFEQEEIWLNAMQKAAGEILGIEENHIIKKMRKHQKGTNQYEKKDIKSSDDDTYFSDSDFQFVQEQGQIFKINLSSYLDNGLFFDHRPLRTIIRDTSSKKRVLNLFCYTGSFSVYAAQGNAAYVESVDLSNTYLDWAKQNMQNNGFSDKQKYVFTRSDCMIFLQQKAVAQKKILAATKQNTQIPDEIKKNAQTYDIIILDPPTFSNSKNTSNVLDINKDWPQLVKDSLNILNPNGVLYFSTNSERLKFNIEQIPQMTIFGYNIECEDITAQTIPNDYTSSKPHRCWKFSVKPKLS